MSKKLPVFDIHGKAVGEVSIKDEVLRVEANPSVIHQVVRYELALERQGGASTKGRSEVSGGGAKPWRQKGTGRARAGSIRSPIWKGGGTVFGPHPRDFSFKLPKKVRNLALKAVLSDRIRQGAVKIVKKFGWTSPSTKKAAEALSKLKVQGKILVVLEDENEVEEKSLRNIPEVKIVHIDQINTYDLLDSDDLVVTKDAFEHMVRERLS